MLRSCSGTFQPLTANDLGEVETDADSDTVRYAGRVAPGALDGARCGAPSDAMPQFTPSSRELSFPTPLSVEDRMINFADRAWVFLSILSLAFIPLSGWIAERRGRSIKFWCWMGFIFGPIGPLVVALLSPASPSGPAPGSGPKWQRTVAPAP
jgi:hypothetical protein